MNWGYLKRNRENQMFGIKKNQSIPLNILQLVYTKSVDIAFRVP